MAYGSQKLNRCDRFMTPSARISALKDGMVTYTRCDVVATRFHCQPNHFMIWYGEVTKVIIRPHYNEAKPSLTGPIYGADWAWSLDTKAFLKMVWYERVTVAGKELRTEWHEEMPHALGGKLGDTFAVFRRVDINMYGSNAAVDVHVTEHVVRKVAMEEWPVPECPRETTWVLKLADECSVDAAHKALPQRRDVAYDIAK